MRFFADSLFGWVAMERPRAKCNGRGRRLAAAAVAGSLLLAAPVALAQDGAPPPPAAAQQPAQAAKPGLFEAIGRWFDEGTATFRTHLRGARQRFDTLGDDAGWSSCRRPAS
jgi:hypothetical protein